jgi:hypothetical protein
MYGLGHAKSGVSPKTRTFSLMFVQPDLEHQACLWPLATRSISRDSSQNFAKSTCRLELEECPETVTMGEVLIFCVIWLLYYIVSLINTERLAELKKEMHKVIISWLYRYRYLK